MALRGVDVQIPDELVVDDKALGFIFARTLRFVHVDVVDQLVQYLLGQRPHFHEFTDGADKFFALTFPFIHFGQLPEINTYVIMQRQFPDLTALLSVLSLRTGDVTILASLPSNVIDSHSEEFWTALSINSLYVRSAIRIDPAILSKPKKKTLFVISDQPQETVALWDSVYDKVSSELSVKGPIREVSYGRFETGQVSIAKFLHQKDAPEAPTKIRNAARKYDFSDEIRLSYTVKTDEYGSPKITASYHEILPVGDRRANGKRLSENVIRRIGEDSKEAVLESIVLSDKLRPVIASDVRSFYCNELDKLTLKTCWFLCRSELDADREYNAEIAGRWFSGNNALSKIRISESTEEDMLLAAESVFGLSRDNIEYSYWRQLDIIIRKLIRTGLAHSNPIEAYVHSRSGMLTARQSEVRDSLVKKSLEFPEMLRVMQWICEDTEFGKRYRVSVEAATGALRLLGLSNAELCALTWADYLSLPHIGRQLRIVRFLDKDGNIQFYGEKALHKIRFFPVPPEIEFMLDTYRAHVMENSGLTEEELLLRPMFSDKTIPGLEDHLSLHRMRTITKHLLKAARIDPLVVTLHDGDESTQTDLHTYRGDFFRENADFYYGRVCGMKDGEICYLLGERAPTTFDAHYLDYSYALMQYRMMVQMRRWLGRHRELIGIPVTAVSEVGIKDLTGEVQIISNGQDVCTAQILFPDGCPVGGLVSVSAENGINWTCMVKQSEEANDD